MYLNVLTVVLKILFRTLICNHLFQKKAKQTTFVKFWVVAKNCKDNTERTCGRERLIRVAGYCVFQQHVDSSIQISTKKCVFATVKQMFGRSSQLPTNAEHYLVVWTVLDDLITVRLAVVGRWEERPNIWLTVAKNAQFVGWALNLESALLLKGVVTGHPY